MADADPEARNGQAPFEPAALPKGLRWLRASEPGRSWLASLPPLVEECVARWSLRVGAPFADSYVSLVLPGKMPEGADVILKIQFPHRESEHEAAALVEWDGDGAVRLLAHDSERHALLIERCSPGTHLSEASGVDALGVLIGLLPRLWQPVSEPFASLGEEASRWAEGLPRQWERAGRPFEKRLVDAAVDILATLGESPHERVLLHQDLHADNVLRAQREPWLVIDPKPLAGDRELGVAPIVRSYELGHSRTHVIGRLDRLTRELGLDRERARGWAFAQTLAWAFEGDDALPRHVETARWVLEDG
jgi:streptomycin 6-kinase